MLKGFRDFILRGNVVDLAVAVVVGGAFNAIVTALVKDVVTPFIAALGGQPNFSTLAFTVHNSKVLYGDFLNALVSFLISAAVVYFFVVIPMNRILIRIKKGEKVDPTEKTCPECLSMIPLKATRCKYCTAIMKN
jgi:large conductance mechanosensitive channel